MSTLVVCALQDLGALQGNQLRLACDLSDELRYSTRVGDDILIASDARSPAKAYVALGKLAGFASDDTGATIALIKDMVLFPEPIPMLHRPAGPGALFEIASETYQKILKTIADPLGFEERGNAFDMTMVESLFLRQLRREQEDICSFSGVRSETLEAVIIRPLDQGGSWHIGNFILLDEAAGTHFNKFNWSVGAQYQLLLNAHAVGQDGMETASPTGMLVMPPKMIERLDRSALEWHRQQFLDRLR